MRPIHPEDYWERRLRDHWSLEGAGHLGYGLPFNTWLYKVRAHVFKMHLRHLGITFSNLRVLDIGSGTGFYLDLWKSLGVKNITGSDMTSFAVKMLRKKHQDIQVIHLDISRPLEFPDTLAADFDVITAFDVLFHIVDDAAFTRAIKNIAALLRPGGFLFFSDNFVHRRAVRTAHQVSRSLEEINTTVADSGLRLIKRTPMFVLMNYPIDSECRVTAILWRLLMLPVRVLHILGYVYGVLLAPLELFLVRALKESPSTEIMLCQKLAP